MVEDLSLHVADLVLNSLRAGAKRIQVSLERKGDRLTLEVTDDGRGMREEELAQALDPFFTTKDAPHGIGLGLALVRQTAEELGGKLEVDSAPERGTRVRLSIPYRHPDRPPLGDLAGTLAPLMISASGVEFSVRLADDRGDWEFTTRELGTAGVALGPGVLSCLEERIREGLASVGLKEDE